MPRRLRDRLALESQGKDSAWAKRVSRPQNSAPPDSRRGASNRTAQGWNVEAARREAQ
jgi:hypothetical protein